MNYTTRDLLNLLSGVNRTANASQTRTRQQTPEINQDLLYIFREFNQTVHELNSESEELRLYIQSVLLLLQLIQSFRQSHVQRPFTEQLIFEQIIPLPTRTSQNGLTPEQIQQNVSTITFHPDTSLNESQRCPISLEDFTDNESVSQINSCRHIFKTEPLNNWLQGHNTCPQCRQVIAPTATASASATQQQSAESQALQSILTSLFSTMIEPN
jgi:hypothetical protein